MRRYDPGPDALLVALAGRVDVLERDLSALSRDVSETDTDVRALGHGVADLTAQIRHLTRTAIRGTATTTRGGPETAGGGASGPRPTPAGGSQGGEEDGADGADGQVDWFALTDPALAADHLHALTTWLHQVGSGHGLTTTPCWPVHPDVVAELLALQAERAHAYAAARPTAVCEWIGRWMPGAQARIANALAACAADRGHCHESRLYETRGADLSPVTVARWWTSDRATPAPVALRLPALD